MLKWFLRALIALVLLVILAAAVVYAMSQRRLTQRVTVPQEALSVHLAGGDVRRGAHFATAIAECMNCHGSNAGGRLFVNDGALGTYYAPNLTRGPGGAAATFTDADWERALRFGAAPDGRPLLIMPSRDFAELSERDFADIVAYIRSLPPVTNTTPPPHVGPVGRFLFAIGQLRIGAEEIHRDAPAPSTVQPAVSVAYGRYLARIGGCMDCHGAHLSGGHLEGAPSDPPAQNLTRGGDLGHWSFEQFTRTLRTGRRPDGSSLASFMPWPQVGQMNDDELRAIFLFLKSVPPRQSGTG